MDDENRRCGFRRCEFHRRTERMMAPLARRFMNTPEHFVLRRLRRALLPTALLVGLVSLATAAAKPPTDGADPPEPTDELIIDGNRHRLLLIQPDAATYRRLRDEGVTTVLHFRHASETPDLDAESMIERAGLRSVNLPYANGAELTPELLDRARQLLRSVDDAGEIAALHCRTGNRIAPAWAAFRAIDQGVPIAQALMEAKALRLVDPLAEAHLREYLRRNAAPRSDPDRNDDLDEHPKDAATWRRVTPADVDDSRRTQMREALMAREMMFSRLFATLGAVLDRPVDGGPVAAIAICRDEAPRIAISVAQERSVMIGRTSARLRNPANGVPAWAAELLGEMSEQERAPNDFPTARFAIHPDGSLGAVAPIRLLSNCLVCHGPTDEIDPAVLAAIGDEYPLDRAVDYREGDLRGWFWIEVPAP